MVRRVDKVLAGTLESGEKLSSCFFAQKYLSFAYALLLGELWYLLLSKPYSVAASNKRFILLAGSRLIQRPKGIVFTDELSNISLSKRRTGLIYDRVVLNRSNDEKTY